GLSSSQVFRFLSSACSPKNIRWDSLKVQSKLSTDVVHRWASIVAQGMCLNQILQKDERELEEKEMFYVRGNCLVILLVLPALARHCGSNKHGSAVFAALDSEVQKLVGPIASDAYITFGKGQVKAKVQSAFDVIMMH
ncbi:hypothetical protein MKW98_015584, partial [Papaver atlanticum]